jgi:hypothetical protein
MSKDKKEKVAEGFRNKTKEGEDRRQKIYSWRGFIQEV